MVAATLVNAEDEIMLIGTSGVLIRTRVNEIREMSRATQGVTLINLGKGEKLAGLSRIAEPEEQDVESDDAAEGAAATDTTQPPNKYP